MNSLLSILCVTNNEPVWAIPFIRSLRDLAHDLGAELVLGLNREKPISCFRGIANTELETAPNTLQDLILDECIKGCSGDWIFRIDNDERVSPALVKWLATGMYTGGSLFAFPRVYMWQDDKHLLANAGMWPDLQTRLGRKELMYGCNTIHAGNPNGTGRIVPYAIEHHSLLVKDVVARRSAAALYESIHKGAGSEPQWARYLLPEDFYPEFTVRDYGNGDFSK